MIREAIVKAPTIDEAKLKAATELGATQEECTFEVLETPKKSLFSKNKEAVVKATIEIIEPVVCANSRKLSIAKEYLQNILDGMHLDTIVMEIDERDDGAVITFNGDGMAALIGHHGETLDALQYLIALTCNRVDGDYYRITLDCGNYRQKREVTLQALGTRIAGKVKKTGRSQLLEPMNPYERRIIHAIVSDIEGVYSKSKGEEPNRRVVILSETPAKVIFNKNTNRKEDATYPRKKEFKEKVPYVHKPERTMEEILKEDFKNKEQKADLYSKVDI